MCSEQCNKRSCPSRRIIRSVTVTHCVSTFFRLHLLGCQNCQQCLTNQLCTYYIVTESYYFISNYSFTKNVTYSYYDRFGQFMLKSH